MLGGWATIDGQGDLLGLDKPPIRGIPPRQSKRAALL
jgi:hypothetical protein